MKKYKFVHLLWNKGTLFFPSFVDRLNENPQLFCIDDHLFVTNYEENYNLLKNKCNIIFDNKKNANLINKYGKKAKWIIVHSMGIPFYRVPFIKRKYAKRVIWRTWGHDVRPCKKTNIKIVDILLECFFQLYIKKIRQFKYIGIASDIDRVSIEEYFGKMEYCSIPYFYEKGRYSKLNSIKESIEKKEPDKVFKILIGHSGFEIDNHIDALDTIAKYKDENIEIILPLSYGDIDYIDKVEQYAKRLFGNKARCIRDRMEYYEYAKLLSSIDVALFNQKYSSALGNFKLLLFFEKTIFFNADGIFAKSFDENGIYNYLTLYDINDLTYSEFVHMKMSREIINIFCDLKSEELVSKEFSGFLNSL